jgi:hypothetical protein
MKKCPWLTVAALATLAAAATAQSQPTLNDARKAVREANTEGVVIIPARKKTAPPPAAAASGAAAASAPSSFLREVARELPPPSGRPIGAARRLDAPDLGIALPSRGASAPR